MMQAVMCMYICMLTYYNSFTLQQQQRPNVQQQFMPPHAQGPWPQMGAPSYSNPQPVSMVTPTNHQIFFLPAVPSIYIDIQ